MLTFSTRKHAVDKQRSHDEVVPLSPTYKTGAVKCW